MINNILIFHTFKGFKFSAHKFTVFIGKGTIHLLVPVGFILLTRFSVRLQEYYINPVENQLLGCTLIATIICGKGNKYIQGNFHQVSNGWNFMLQTHSIQSSISPFMEFMLPLFIL